MPSKKLLLIEWLDSRGVTSGWEDLEDIEPLKPDRITSVGFVIEETDEYKTMVGSVGTTQVFGRMTIPCCSILRTVELPVLAPPND